MKDWIISSQAPKLAMIEHGEGSESRRLWVLNDGLINLIMLKVYSGLARNGKDIRQNHTMLMDFFESIYALTSTSATGGVLKRATP